MGNVLWYFLGFISVFILTYFLLNTRGKRDLRPQRSDIERQTRLVDFSSLKESLMKYDVTLESAEELDSVLKAVALKNTDRIKEEVTEEIVISLAGTLNKIFFSHKSNIHPIFDEVIYDLKMKLSLSPVMIEKAAYFREMEKQFYVKGEIEEGDSVSSSSPCWLFGKDKKVLIRGEIRKD